MTQSERQATSGARPPGIPLPSILVVGRRGQLGLRLLRALALLGPVTAWGREDTGLGRDGGLWDSLDELSPDVVVNAAAWTRVDAAEGRPDHAARDNSELPAALADWAGRRGALMVHYSTDYVFDGAKGSPYLETDPAAPLNVYGRTKLDGDERVLALAPGAIVFRTGWVYSPLGRNFPNTILEMAVAERELRITDEQRGAPTPADLLAQVTFLAIRERLEGAEGPSGLYNVAASGETTWLGFAQRLLERAREMRFPLRPGLPILKPAAPGEPERPERPAKRPADSRLDTAKIRSELGINLPDWEWCLDRFLETVAARHKL